MRTPTPTPITIAGFTGLPDELNDTKLRAARHAQFIRRHPDDIADDQERAHAIADIFVYVYASHGVAKYHNHMIGLLVTYRLAADAAQLAGIAATDAYNELSRPTTTAWHAAHHRYIIAVTDAQDAYAALLEAATPLTAYHNEQWRGPVADFYEQLVPADQRLSLPDTGSLPAEISAFTETHRHRLTLLSHTIAGTIPDGFEPEHTPRPATPPTDHTRSRR